MYHPHSKPQRTRYRSPRYKPDFAYKNYSGISDDGHFISVGKHNENISVDVFLALPKKVSSMYLYYEGFKYLATPEVITALIPGTITELHLGYNLLGSKTTEELKSLFAAIPSTVTRLNLNNNTLGQSPVDLAAVFAKLPPGLKVLNLGGNSLHLKSGHELKDAFETLPPTLEKLNLEGNELGQLTDPELAIAFTGISLSVSTLNLNKNEFSRKIAAQLSALFANIPEGVNKLKFHLNYDNSERTAHLAAALPSIPQHVTYLDLSENYLYDKKQKLPLVTFTKAIPKTITHLKFGWHQLGDIQSKNLVGAVAALDGLNCLDIRNSKLFYMRSSNFKKQLFAAIPPNVKTLLVSYSDIEHCDDRTLIALGNSLSHIVDIKVTYEVSDRYDEYGGKHEFDYKKVKLLKNNIGNCVLEAGKELLELKDEKNHPLLPTPIMFEILSMVTGQEAELSTFLEEHRSYLENSSIFESKSTQEEKSVTIHVQPQRCTVS